MIVPMKKVSLIVLDTHREASLKKLREVGVLHLQSTAASSETLSDLHSERTVLENALRLLPESEEPVDTPALSVSSAIGIASRAAGLAEKSQTLAEESNRLHREMAELSEWGDFDPTDILALRKKGIDIRLYRLTRRQLEEIPEGVRTFVLKQAKSASNVALVLMDDAAEIPFDEFSLPERGLSEIEQISLEKRSGLEEIKKELVDLAAHKPAIESALEEIDGDIEFESARAGMEVDEKLAFLTGYTPTAKVADLKKAAAANGWAIVIDEPAEGEPVPTLIENPKWMRIVQPVFDILGTIPGYREHDISFWFLLFLTFFYAIIIGDGAYGMIFLIGTFIARRKFPKAPSEPFALLYTMSTAAVIWGAVTGTWFGSETLARSTLLSWAIYPDLYSFAANVKQSQAFWMHLCFVVGAVHLTLAHLKGFARLSPALRSYAELGWIALIWGLYYVVRWLILKQDLHPAGLILVGTGLFLIMLFSEQEGSFLKGAGWGIVKFPMTILSGIGCFSDIMSYVRLFAVSLAALEVSKSTNAMAAGVGFGLPHGIGAALILLVGHSLNIVLGALSVIVHGVRLNLLEYSGHLKMEWSGSAYNPFRART